MAKWPHEEVSESGKTYPEGLYKIKITKQEDGEAKNGQFSVMVQSRIVEPKQYRNQPYDFMFVIGVTDDTAGKLGIEEGDLAAENEETWTKNPSARRYKSFLKAAGVASTGDTEEEGEDVRGKTLYVQNNVRDNKYNDANAFYPEGEAPAGALASSDEKPAKSGAPLAKRTSASKDAKAAAKAKPAEPVDEDGDGDDWES